MKCSSTKQMKKVLLSFLISLFCFSVFSQIQVDENSGYSLKDRGFLGLGIGGLGFGTGAYGSYYSIGLTPQAGYMFNQYVSAGFAFEYQYVGYPDLHQNYTRYGWYPFLRLNIKNFFIQSDYDWYSIPAVTSSNNSERKIF